MKLCLVEDEPISLAVLTGVISGMPGVTVQPFASPMPALEACRRTGFDLLIVDHQMPDVTGIEVISTLRTLSDYRHVPIIMVTADNDRAVKLAAIRAGATEFLAKPADPEEIRLRVGNLLELRRAQLALSDRAVHLALEVEAATRRIKEREEELIWRLARAIEYRDGQTGNHVTRVARVSQAIAQALGQPAEFCHNIFLAAPLHDTGKLAVPDAILNKPGRLTEDETEVMRRHTSIGAEILSDGTSDLILMAQEIALGHHERWDGMGYPQGLAGEAIPLAARIVAVADVIDALCSERPYKAAWPHHAARAEIERLSGQHFDPACVMGMGRAWDRITEVLATIPNSHQSTATRRTA